MDKLLQGVLIAVIILGSSYLVYSFVAQTGDAPITLMEKSTQDNLQDTSQVVSLGTCPADEQVIQINETPHSPLYKCTLAEHQELVLVREVDDEYTARLLDTATGEEVTLWTNDAVFRSTGPGFEIYNYSLRRVDEDLIEVSIDIPVIQASLRYSKFINLAEGKLVSSVTSVANGGFEDEVTPCGNPQTGYTMLVVKNEEACYEFALLKNIEGNIEGVLQDGMLVEKFNPPLRTTRLDLSLPAEELWKAEMDFAEFVDIVPSPDGRILNFAIKSLYSLNSGPITISLEAPGF